MHALMTKPEFNLPIIVNMDSHTFAELSAAGYIPIAQGYKKQLEEIERDMMEEMYGELELNNETN